MSSESESVEWKRSLGEWKEIVVATAAMASLHGGRICIGVEPTGRVCGVELGKGTLIVSVPESTPKPVYAFDRPYRRAGKTNQGQISRREYAKQLDVSPETAKRDLGKLVSKGVLAMRRAGRSTVYTLIGS